ncbi:MAG: hypothetical protein R3D25_21285 [Geminicoccaceae bacterium]
MTIELVVDYGTGATKTFSGIPHQTGMGVDDVLQVAELMRPGLHCEVSTEEFVNRAGLAEAHITRIDGVDPLDGSAWRIDVDGEPVTWQKQVAHLHVRRPHLSDHAKVTIALVEGQDD